MLDDIKKKIFGTESSLDFLKASNFSENNVGFVRSDLWEVHFIQFPKSVYYPGDDIIRIRLDSVTFDPDMSNSVLSETIRGFTVNQNGTSTPNGTVGLSFKDRADQSIKKMVISYQSASGNRNDRTTLLKEDLVSIVSLTRFNETQKPIENYTLYNCIYAGGAVPNTYSAEASLLAEVSLEMNYEYFDHKLLNV